MKHKILWRLVTLLALFCHRNFFRELFQPAIQINLSDGFRMIEVYFFSLLFYKHGKKKKKNNNMKPTSQNVTLESKNIFGQTKQDIWGWNLWLAGILKFYMIKTSIEKLRIARLYSLRYEPLICHQDPCIILWKNDWKWQKVLQY